MDQFEINVKLADESPNAAYETGYAYFLGRGTQKDLLQALPYLQKAADAGHNYATILLADTYEKESTIKRHSDGLSHRTGIKPLS